MAEKSGGDVEGETNRLGLAFGVVIGAGFMTTVGATVIFFSRRANTALLAAMLGLSAGVILYVSFVGLYITESVHGFQDSGYEGSWPLRHATFCFFGGMLLMWLLEKLSSAIMSLDKCWGPCDSKRKGRRMVGLREDEREEGGIDHGEGEGLGNEPGMASVLVTSTHNNPLSFPPFVLVEEEDDKPAFLGMRMPAPDPRYTCIQPSSGSNVPAPTAAPALGRASHQSCAPAGTSHHHGLSIMSDSPSPLSMPTPGHDGCASPLAARQLGCEQGGVVPPEGASAAAATQHGSGSCAASFSSGIGGGAAVHLGGGRSAAGCSGDAGDGGGGGGSVTEKASRACAESVQHLVSHPAPPLAPPTPPPPSPPPPSPSAFRAVTDEQQEQQWHNHQQQQQQHLQHQQQQQHHYHHQQQQHQQQHHHQQQQQESHLDQQLDDGGEQAGCLCSKPRLLVHSVPDPSVLGSSSTTPTTPTGFLANCVGGSGHGPGVLSGTCSRADEGNGYQSTHRISGAVCESTCGSAQHGLGIQAATHPDAVTQENSAWAPQGQKIQAADEDAASVCEGSKETEHAQGIKAADENSASVCEGRSGTEHAQGMRAADENAASACDGSSGTEHAQGMRAAQSAAAACRGSAGTHHGDEIEASNCEAGACKGGSWTKIGHVIEAADCEAVACRGSSRMSKSYEIEAADCGAAAAEGGSGSQNAQEIQEDGSQGGRVQGEEPAAGPGSLSSWPHRERAQQQQQQQQQLEQQAWQARRAWQFRSSSLGRRGTAAAARAQGATLAACVEEWQADRGPENRMDSVQHDPSAAYPPQLSRLEEECHQQQQPQQQQQRLEQQAWQARRAWQFQSSSLGRRGTAADAGAGPQGQTSSASCVELCGGLGKKATENGRREVGALGAGVSSGGAPRRLPNGWSVCEEKESGGNGASHPFSLQGEAPVRSVQGAPVNSVSSVLAPTALPVAVPWWRQCSNRTHRSALSTTLTSEISCGDESREIEAELERLELGEGSLPFLSSANSRPLPVTVDAASPLPGPECFDQCNGAHLDRQHVLPWRRQHEKWLSSGKGKRGGGGCGEEKGWKGKAEGSVDLEDGGGERAWVGPLSKFNSSREPLGGRWSEDRMEGMEGASQRGGREGSFLGRPHQWLGERLVGLMRWLVLCRRGPKSVIGEGEVVQSTAVTEDPVWTRSDACGCLCKHKHQRHIFVGEGGRDEVGEVGSEKEGEQSVKSEGQSGGMGTDGGRSRQQGASIEEEKKRLGRVGMLTGLAIAIHNFPEGMAAFLAVLGDPRAGISLAVAIAIHNVPEGMVIAFPISISTGSKWRGWAYGAGAGLMEPIGALVAWGALGDRTDDRLVFGIIFGIVAGMMVAVCLMEVLPTAFNYDPEDKWVTKGIALGLLIMAAGTIAF